ncbi:MAG: 3'(2'),5'-bisphosphate nucleotidase CysQ [Alphaproteobacteria bacterium]|nr:3'(2'),5'-bisphosphate nucleotidase CysQ [Alphaproteobacteria bacterium]
MSEGILVEHSRLLAAVAEAGALARAAFGGDVKSWDKAPGQIVTETDLAVDRLLYARLKAGRAGFAWLSEEGADDPTRFTAPRVWVVDPIDGTRAFACGIPEFAIAAALVEDGQAVAGAVYNPATDELFEATLGGGARLNGRTIRVGTHPGIAGARLLTSRRHLDESPASAAFAEAEIVAVRSIAYRMALVAAGTFDAMLTLRPKSDWDLAAAALVVSEAGGVVSDTGGAALAYNRASLRHASAIAANPTLQAALIAALGEGARKG